MHEYRCKILRVVDGDTVDVDIDLGFGIWIHKERVRVMGIDTPESRTRDLVEKAFGLAAKEYLKMLLPVDSIKVLKTEVDKKATGWKAIYKDSKWEITKAPRKKKVAKKKATK